MGHYASEMDGSPGPNHRVKGSARSEGIADAAAYLSTVADQLDKWAEESRTGGWSTHQVAGNIDLANSCRRMAARLRALA